VYCIYELAHAEIIGDVKGIRVDRYTMGAARFFLYLLQRIAIAGAECKMRALSSKRQSGCPTNSFA
jgi:hypothetical protein